MDHRNRVIITICIQWIYFYVINILEFNNCSYKIRCLDSFNKDTAVIMYYCVQKSSENTLENESLIKNEQQVPS